EAVWRMSDEVGEGHLARQDEGHRPREEAEEQEEPPDKFKHAAHASEGSERHRAAPRDDRAREGEELRRPHFHEHERHDDAEEAQKVRSETFPAVAHGFSILPAARPAYRSSRPSLRRLRASCWPRRRRPTRSA